MFRARYSSWRGLTFRFVPNYRGAYAYYLFIYLLFPLTLGFIFPYIKWRQKKFLVEHHRFGGKAFSFVIGANDFYVVYFIALGMLIVLYVGIFSLMSTVVASIGGGSPMYAFYVITAFVYLAYFAIFVFLAARVLNLTYNNVVIEGSACALDRARTRSDAPVLLQHARHPA